MNKLITFLVFVVMTSTAWSQTPEKMSYQAVVRDASNTLLANQTVGMQISIIKTTSVGIPVYTETQTPTTNTNGLVSIEIGAGSIVSGDFTIIDWASNVYFIKTEIDPTGGTNYTITGTSQLMSVPYALYAKTSGSSTPGPQGETGATGSQGVQGDTGAQGVQGVAGTDGVDGVQGDTGVAGADGNTWLFGTAIPTTEGVDGDFYLKTDDFEVYQKAAGTWSATGNITGATGSQGIQGVQGVAGTDGVDGAQGDTGVAGADGNIWLFGTAIPSTEGLDGDFYLKTDDFEVYQKASGTWSATGNIKGATGSQGIQGDQGDTGAAGTNGNTWLFGTSIPTTEGLDGDFYLKTDNFEVYQKAAGTWSSTGNIKGAQGATGAQGIQGIAGNNGADGVANTTLYTATGNGPLGIASGTFDLQELTLTFTLNSAAKVITSYSFGGFIGDPNGWIYNCIYIDGVLITGGCSISHNSIYFSNSGQYISELGAGTHTINIKYSSSSNGNSSGTLYQVRKLQVMVFD